ncbi:MAG: hydrogenase maturation protease [Firmicutes bacterium]|nr:hydrogenase maturation protease [Bacillota bacterium]
MSDDAAGLRAVREVSGRAWPGPVEFVEATACAPDVLPAVTPRLYNEPLDIIVVDAVSTGRPAGTVVRSPLEYSRTGYGHAGRLSLHTLGLEAMLAPLNIMGIAPRSVTLVGVEAGSTLPGDGLTGALVDSWDSFIQALVDEVLALISGSMGFESAPGSS